MSEVAGRFFEEAARRADEPLLPELEMYVEEDGPFGPALKHPFVYELILTQKWRANDQYNYKVKALKSAVKNQDWHSFVYLHERPYRAMALESAALRGDIDDGDYWELTSSTWTDTENHWQHRLEWNRLLRSNRSHRERFMDDDERESFNALPDSLTVYRGWNGSGTAKGLAWTLEREKGIWFAHRLIHDGEPPSLAAGIVQKEHTLGLLQGRGEQEIVIPRIGRIQITEIETGIS
jgi:hypothetical protein